MESLKYLAAVTVLYNPDKNVYNTILSYLNEVEKLYLIDNSEKQTFAVPGFIKDNLKIDYTKNNTNLGVAAALNIGANRALKAGYKFLLTMDQDSEVTPHMISDLIQVFEIHQNAGIAAPIHINKYDLYKKVSKTFQEILTTETSGNILNLEVYKKTGPFNEELFIDYVDIEYCMRINNLGYKIFQVNNAILIHKEADISRKIFFFRQVHPYNHRPIRFYYKTRNRFYLRDKYKKKYPEYFRAEFKMFLNNLLKMLIYEENKYLKFKMVVLGYLDYRKGIFGRMGH